MKHPACAASSSGTGRWHTAEQFTSAIRALWLALTPFRRTPHASRVHLFIDRSEIEDATTAEHAALGIYRQVARRPLKVVQRARDKTRHVFLVEFET